MRKILFLVTVILAGCSDSKKDEPSPDALSLSNVYIADQEVVGTSALIEVPLQPEIKLVFNQAFEPSLDFKPFISLLNKNGETISSDFVLSNENKTITVKPLSSLSGFEKYTFVVRSGLSSASKGILPKESSSVFYTSAGTENKFEVISDEALLTKVQAQTFKYFWDFAHSASGLIRERNTSGNTVTTGGTGFGMMAVAVGVERGFISRSEGLARVRKVTDFLKRAEKFHGAFGHWYDGNTAQVLPFSAKDNGADLVETSFLMMGLITAAEYFEDTALSAEVEELYQAVEWNFFLNKSESLFWHWSPDFGFELNLKIQGWNEALMTYVLAAGSAKYGISKEEYTKGWTRNGAFVNGSSYYGIKLPLGEDDGGPMFISQYSFLGLNPNGLADDYISNYAEQARNHTLVNRSYCIANPNKYPGYTAQSWGLTASDNPTGYSAHSPKNDKGVITPTAALGSFAFAPDESMEALKFFYYKMGDKLWGEYGFKDAYSVKDNWYANSYIAIDQGPIIISIENNRTGLLWNNCMKNANIRNGLKKIGFKY